MARGGYRSRDYARVVRYTNGHIFEWFVRRSMDLDGVEHVTQFGRHSRAKQPQFAFLHQLVTGPERPLVQILTFPDPAVLKLLTIPEGYTSLTTAFLIPVIGEDISEVLDYFADPVAPRLFHTADALNMLALEGAAKGIDAIDVHLMQDPLAKDQFNRIQQRLWNRYPILDFNLKTYAN